MTQQAADEGGKVVSIAAFRGRRERAAAGPAHPPAAEPEEVTLQCVELGFFLADVGIARDPIGEVHVTGPGAMLDRGHRVLPLYTPRQARLLAEALLTAARAAECARCSAAVPLGAVADAPAPCAQCGGDV